MQTGYAVLYPTNTGLIFCFSEVYFLWSVLQSSFPAFIWVECSLVLPFLHWLLFACLTALQITICTNNLSQYPSTVSPSHVMSQHCHILVPSSVLVSSHVSLLRILYASSVRVSCLLSIAHCLLNCQTKKVSFLYFLFMYLLC